MGETGQSGFTPLDGEARKMMAEADARMRERSEDDPPHVSKKADLAISLFRMLAEELEIDRDKIGTLVKLEDLALGRLDKIQIALFLEEAYSIMDIPDGDSTGWQTFGDVLRYVVENTPKEATT